jgi:hypothetical protein
VKVAFGWIENEVMKIVSVAAPCNGSGKTSLILTILNTFPGVFSAAKFTTIYSQEQFCPVGDDLCACHRLEGQYSICTNPEVLSQPNTDTGKIWRVGVKQIFWCVARQEGYPEMLKELSASHLKDSTPLLMEGSTIVQYLPPDLSLFVVNPSLPTGWWKKDSEEFLERSDFLILNSYLGKPGASRVEVDPAIRSALGRLRAKQIDMESQDRLDHWQDRRLYQAISRLIDSDGNGE